MFAAANNCVITLQQHDMMITWIARRDEHGKTIMGDGDGAEIIVKG